MQLEQQMLSRFQQRSIPFVARPPQDDWDRLFLMQHSRIPTRLLDWTENPFVALYFALTCKPETPNGDAALWILDPVAWNRKSLDHISFSGGVLSHDDTLVNGFKPGEDYDQVNAEPVAISGLHNTARIVAQRGVFTVFGKDGDPMESIYVKQDYPQDCLVKARLPYGDRASLLRSLFQIGFTHSVIFPDLEGFAKEMKQTFGFVD